MHCSTENAHLSEALTSALGQKGLWAVEIGLSLLLLGYVFRSVLAFAAWTLEFLWS